MSQQSEAYARYCAQHHSEPTEVVLYGYEKKRALVASATKLRHDNKCWRGQTYTRPDGLWSLPDGRVMEVIRDSQGNPETLYIFASLPSWQRHDPPLPWNLYFGF